MNPSLKFLESDPKMAHDQSIPAAKPLKKSILSQETSLHNAKTLLMNKIGS